MIDIQLDTTGAQKKTRALFVVPKAMNRLLNAWGAETVKILKRRAAGMQRAGSGRKTGQLARNIGMERVAGSGERTLVVGTGVGGTKEVKYASIQDQGGTITAKNAHFTIQNIAGKPNVGPYLTVPLKNTKGRMADYPGSFVIRSKKGNLLVVQNTKPAGSMTTKAVYDPLLGRRVRAAKPGGLRALFVLKYQVRIPASHWFTDVIDAQRRELEILFAPRTVLEEASEEADYGGDW